MYVGFSASTEGSTEAHMIESWSFKTFGFPIQNISFGTRSMIPLIPENANSNSPHMIKPCMGLAILGPIALSIAFVALCCIVMKKWMEMKLLNGGLRQNIIKGPRRFSYKELITATKGFHNSLIVGKGSFGIVYQSVNPHTGMTYAVKRLKQGQENMTEFMDEMPIIASLRHKNLVQLEGWCVDKGELLLVYEFMKNGSLDKLLYPKLKSENFSLLNWRQRYNVIVGIASVLSYLHQECDHQVIHRDKHVSYYQYMLNKVPHYS